jgi:hypothetical protein
MNKFPLFIPRLSLSGSLSRFLEFIRTPNLSKDPQDTFIKIISLYFSFLLVYNLLI